MPEDRFEAFRREAGSGVLAPEFTALESASRRRRRIRAGGSALAVVAVMAAGFTGARAISASESTPPTHHGVRPTPTTPHHTTPAAQPAVHVPANWRAVVGVAQSASSPGTQALLGQAGHGAEVLVTTDGFRHSTLADTQSGSLTAVGAAAFVVCGQVNGPGDLRAQVVTATGSVRQVRLSTVAGPISSGEGLVECPDNGLAPYAIDPSTATGHPLPAQVAPNDELDQVAVSASGVLFASVDAHGTPDRVAVSDNRGATWQLESVACPDAQPAQTSTDTLAFSCDPLSGSGSAWMIRSLDDGATWSRIRSSTLADGTVTWSTIEPDGSLLLCLDTSTGQRVLRSEGSTWTRLTTVPAVPEHGAVVLATALHDGAQSLFIASFSDDRVYRSTDGGLTWQLFSAS